MYKGTITTATAVTAGTDIPFVTKLNTNQHTAARNGEVRINSTGYYQADASVVITGYTASTAISLQLYADGVAIPEAIATAVPGSTTTSQITLPVHDIIRVLPDNFDIAKLSARLSGAATIESGIFTLSKMR